MSDPIIPIPPIVSMSAVSWADQSEIFLAMTKAVFQERCREEAEPQDMDEVLGIVEEGIDQMRRGVIGGYGASVNLADLVAIAAQCMHAAHATVMGHIDEAILLDMLLFNQSAATGKEDPS